MRSACATRTKHTTDGTVHSKQVNRPVFSDFRSDKDSNTDASSWPPRTLSAERTQAGNFVYKMPALQPRHTIDKNKYKCRIKILSKNTGSMPGADAPFD